MRRIQKHFTDKKNHSVNKTNLNVIPAEVRDDFIEFCEESRVTLVHTEPESVNSVINAIVFWGG